MDFQQLSTPMKIAGAAGVVLFISLFLPWYSASSELPGLGASVDASAWEAFGFIDILLFLAAVVAIAVAVAGAQNRSAALPVPAPTLLLAAGGLATLLVLYRLIDLPGPDVDVDGFDFGRSFGIFIGLIAAAAIAYAGKLLQDESVRGPGSPTL